MDFIKLEIDEKYLCKAVDELKLELGSFPNWVPLREKLISNIHDLQNNIEIVEWINLIDVKFKELTTSVIYCHAFHYYAIDHSLYGKSDKNNWFYEPRVSYFIANSLSNAFSALEKFAQMLNCYGKLELDEAGNGSKAVSFSNIYKSDRLNNKYKTILMPLNNEINKIKEERHSHIHRYDSEMNRTKIDVSKCTIMRDGKVVEDNIDFVRSSIKRPPIAPYQQLKKCKSLYIIFRQCIEKVFEEMQNEM